MQIRGKSVNNDSARSVYAHLWLEMAARRYGCGVGAAGRAGRFLVHAWEWDRLAAGSAMQQRTLARVQLGRSMSPYVHTRDTEEVRAVNKLYSENLSSQGKPPHAS